MSLFQFILLENFVAHPILIPLYRKGSTESLFPSPTYCCCLRVSFSCIPFASTSPTYDQLEMGDSRMEAWSYSFSLVAPPKRATF